MSTQPFSSTFKNKAEHIRNKKQLEKYNFVKLKGEKAVMNTKSMEEKVRCLGQENELFSKIQWQRLKKRLDHSGDFKKNGRMWKNFDTDEER